MENSRPKRKAFLVATQKLQSQKPNLRRNGKVNALNDISNNATLLSIQLTEKEDKLMPPPAVKPKGTHNKKVDSSDTENESSRVTRVTRSKTKSRKDLDVILQEVPVPVVIIEDAANQLNSEAEQITESSAQVIESAFDTDDDAPLKSRTVTKKTKKKQPKKTEKPKEPAKETVQLRTCTVSSEKKMLEMERLEEKRIRQLATKPPPLPVDYEDSGSESDQPERNPTYEQPEWARSQNFDRLLMLQRCIPKSIIERLFQLEAQTPDLREIF